MITWSNTETRFPAFTYYPALEIGVGIFLLIMAFVVPILFVVYNGVKAEQWGELLFCGGFFVLFFFMGRSLTFQSLKAWRHAEGFSFYQNLRDPAVQHDLSVSDWLGLKTEEEPAKDQRGEPIKNGEIFIKLLLKTPQGAKELYRSINAKEIKNILAALEELRRKSEEANP